MTRSGGETTLTGRVTADTATTIIPLIHPDIVYPKVVWEIHVCEIHQLKVVGLPSAIVYHIAVLSTHSVQVDDLRVSEAHYQRNRKISHHRHWLLGNHPSPHFCSRVRRNRISVHRPGWLSVRYPVNVPLFSRLVVGRVFKAKHCKLLASPANSLIVIDSVGQERQARYSLLVLSTEIGVPHGEIRIVNLHHATGIVELIRIVVRGQLIRLRYLPVGDTDTDLSFNHVDLRRGSADGHIRSWVVFAWTRACG